MIERCPIIRGTTQLLAYCRPVWLFAAAVLELPRRRPANPSSRTRLLNQAAILRG